MSDEEKKPEDQSAAPAAPVQPAAPAPAAPAAPAAPEKPAPPLGRNGRPIISRTYLGLLLAVVLALPLAGCAGSAAGNGLNFLAGVREVHHNDGSVTYEKDPSSPLESVAGIFGPLAGLLGTTIAGGIYAFRKMHDTVPASVHAATVEALTNKQPGPGEGA